MKRVGKHRRLKVDRKWSVCVAIVVMLLLVDGGALFPKKERMMIE
jgi:hypothetical protein